MMTQVLTVNFGKLGSRDVLFRDVVGGTGIPIRYVWVGDATNSGFMHEGYWALCCWSMAPMESRSTGYYDDHPKAPVYLGESRAEVEQTLRKARYGAGA